LEGLIPFGHVDRCQGCDGQICDDAEEDKDALVGDSASFPEGSPVLFMYVRGSLLQEQDRWSHQGIVRELCWLGHQHRRVRSIMGMHEVCPGQLGHNLGAWQQLDLPLGLELLRNLGVDLWVAVDRHGCHVVRTNARML
jgi:hypothetical protein